MNCKPGELAIRVSAHARSMIPVGAIVTVVRYDGTVRTGVTNRVLHDAWSVEYRGSLIAPTGRPWVVPDRELRPLRDNDGEDETLTWVGKPVEATA